VTVLMITDDFPPLIGGMATHAWELSKALVQLGHKVTVLTGAIVCHAKSRFALPKVEMVDGVQVINFGFTLGLRRYHKYWFNREVKRYLLAFEEVRKDVVLHVHEHMRPLSIRKLSRLPLVWTNHSSMFLRDFDDDSKKSHLTRLVQSCDWITAPSRELCAKTVALSYPEERVTYIPNGVDVRRFNVDKRRSNRILRLHGKMIRLSDDTCVVLCARRFVYKNGLHIYLDALEALPPEMLSNCTLLFAGNQCSPQSTYEREILERLESMSPRVNLHLLGAVPNDVMPDLYRAADIAVLPSLKEATSITGLEAMASGLPIVGTNVGGIPEIVEHDVTGLLCEPNDPHGLAHTLATLIHSTALRKQLGSEGRKVAQANFSWNIIAQRFLRVYESAISYHHTVVP